MAESLLWQIVAYAAMACVIGAMLVSSFEKWGFFSGSILLLLYAYFGIHDSLLLGLQIITSISATLYLTKLDEKLRIRLVKLSALCVLISLLSLHIISTPWHWVGFTAIAFIALAMSSKRGVKAYWLFIIGGILITIYSYAGGVVVFFILNVIFALLALFRLIKEYKNSP